MEDRLISGVAAGELQVFSPELFSYISGDLISAVRPAFRRNTANADTSYAYGLRDDAFVTALEMNLFHFSAGKTLAEIQALSGAFRESSSYTDFREAERREICGTFNRTWQRTEYETAVLAAESASNYHRLMAKKKLFYRSGDTSPPAMTGYAGSTAPSTVSSSGVTIRCGRRSTRRTDGNAVAGSRR